LAVQRSVNSNYTSLSVGRLYIIENPSKTQPIGDGAITDFAMGVWTNDYNTGVFGSNTFLIVSNGTIATLVFSNGNQTGAGIASGGTAASLTVTNFTARNLTVPISITASNLFCPLAVISATASGFTSNNCGTLSTPNGGYTNNPAGVGSCPLGMTNLISTGTSIFVLHGTCLNGGNLWLFNGSTGGTNAIGSGRTFFWSTNGVVAGVISNWFDGTTGCVATNGLYGTNILSATVTMALPTPSITTIGLGGVSNAILRVDVTGTNFDMVLRNAAGSELSTQRLTGVVSPLIP
jgi:hypothetical protein